MNVPALTAAPEALAAATPPDRDRYLDLLRALSIAAVVFGHWLVAVVWIGDGQLRAAAAVDLSPATQWATWIVQVMPLFFLVGGVVNVRSWRATRLAGGAYASWIARRAARLLRPTTVLVWVWLVLAPTALLAGVDRGMILLGARSALVPLWFLAVYLLMIALVPPLLGLYERLGLWLPAVCIAGAATVDAAVDATVPAMVNYLLVWAVPTTLGFAWADGRLDRRFVRIGLPLAGLAALMAAVTLAGYPVSMVGLAEAGTDGPNVPAVTLALLGCVQTGIASAARTPVTAWLQRPGTWAWVVRLNAVAMTVYLWHLTVLVLVVGGLTLTGSWWSITPLSVAWWATRPLWLAALATCLAPVVVALSPIEHSVPAPRPRGRGFAATAGMVAVPLAAAVAIAALTLGGVLGVPAVAGTILLTAAAVHAGAFAPRTVTR